MNIDPVVAQTFLWSLYGALPNPQIEFRLIRGKFPDSDVAVHFSRLDTLLSSDEMWNHFAEQNRDGWNVYFGVATRDQSNKAEIVPAVWADIDFKTLSGGLLPVDQRTLLQLLMAEYRPSMVVESGHGIHAYWRLDPEVGPEDHTRVKTVNKQIAKVFGGDNVSDLARILRLPGFYNVKDRSNPVRCNVSTASTGGIIEQYTLDALERWLADIPVPQLSQELDDLIEHGNQGQYASRSEADFACVLGLVARGFGEEEIFAIYDEKPIGEKYRDKGAYGEGYLLNTIQAAQHRLAHRR